MRSHWFAAVVLLLGTGLATRADEPAWRYVVPSPGDPFEHPPPRVIALSRQKPDDLKEAVRYRGQRQRYTQIHYGSPAGVRVTIVLDEVSATDTDLYVDTSRSRSIGPRDRVEGANGTWRLPLDVAVLEGGKTDFVPRTVLFRLGRVSRTLSLATCGYLEGRTQAGDRTVAVRRVDGDGNGFFADPQDRLWLDLDGDGRWDPVQEQFLYTPILQLGTARYAVRSDPLGRRLALRKLEGTGTVRLAVQPPALAQGIEELSATLMGRDGSVVTLHGADAQAILPVGEYRMSVLALTLKDPAGGPAWHYVFSDDGLERPRSWHPVAKDGTRVINPIGRLAFQAGLDAEAAACRPGKVVGVQPQLYTGDGLLINTVTRDHPSVGLGYGGCSASVALTAADGTVLASGSSGFA